VALIAKYRSFTRVGQFNHVRFACVIQIPPLADFFYCSKTALAKTVTVIYAAHPDTWGWNFLV
jgi:hypothetical protein